MLKFRQLLLATLLVLSNSIVSNASDHIDGPITMQHQASDLTDLFAFSKNPGHLTLVMNSYPFLLKNGHFTDKLFYKFVVRKASITGVAYNAQISTSASDEVVITCQFSDGHNNQTVTCSSDSGLYVKSPVEKVGRSDDGQVKVFAGHRADPFFFSVGWSDKVRFNGILPRGKFSNSVDKTNILSIIIEFPVEKVFGNSAGSIFAVAAETVSIKSGARLDRLGRPEITNFAMQLKDDEDEFEELRDQYNQLQLFDNSDFVLRRFRERIKTRIKMYDEVDGIRNWQNKQRKLDALVDILLNDFLVIDISVPCQGQDNFFGIEQAMLDGYVGKSCGGRKLTDDFVDQQFTLYITAGDFNDRIRDGVSKPYKAPLNYFPYLAKPDRSRSGRLKRLMGAAAGAALRLKNR